MAAYLWLRLVKPSTILSRRFYILFTFLADRAVVIFLRYSPKARFFNISYLSLLKSNEIWSCENCCFIYYCMN